MNEYVFYYCPHCCPSGVTLTSANYAPPVRTRFCEQYWQLIDQQQEQNRGRVMWQEQL